MEEHLSGTVDRVVFHNPESGFAILRVQTAGTPGLVTVAANSPRVVAGEFLEAVGRWADDPEFGKQFNASSIRLLPPSTIDGIEKYLGSGLVKGIGKHYAKKIVAVFGAQTLHVIDESPTYLKEIRGIGAKRIQKIRESWVQQKAVREIMVFLQSHGVGTGQASRIYRTYGDRALGIVRENPYRLADDVWGIGFQTADQLALKMGYDPQAIPRAEAAIRLVLKEASGEGHCALPESQMYEQAAQRTGIGLETLQAAAQRRIDQGDLVRETVLTPEPWIYLRNLHQAEAGIAERLVALLEGAHPLQSFDVESALAGVEKTMAISLAPSQREALRSAAASRVLVITGGPGVGKTTLVRGILEIYGRSTLRIHLCAPTGRAAKRLAESTGREAKTIHRLLEFDHRGPQRDADTPLEVDLLIVDETSMVDVTLMHQLLRALPASACLILVGDADQLPSVGPGNVLAEILRVKGIPAVRLTQVFRQAQESGIVRAAYRILQGEMPESAPDGKLGDFYVIEAESPAAILERILALIQDRIPARFGLDPVKEIQVLTPMNRSDLGVKKLNLDLQAILNPPDGQDAPEVARFGTSFRQGDKVMQTRNNYQKEVFNGDVGRIHAIDGENQELSVDYDGRIVVYEFDELDELMLAYALTIHKSQGSEYPAVVVPLHTQHYLLLQRNLLYTAVTRGRRLVVLVGSRKAISLAIQRHATANRYTALSARLQKAVADK